MRRRVAVRKQKLYQEHIDRRLQYSIQFRDWMLPNNKFGLWSKTIFIDEFGVDTSDGKKTHVWRTIGTRFSARNIKPKQVTDRFKVSFIVR